MYTTSHEVQRRNRRPAERPAAIPQVIPSCSAVICLLILFLITIPLLAGVRPPQKHAVRNIAMLPAVRTAWEMLVPVRQRESPAVSLPGVRAAHLLGNSARRVRGAGTMAAVVSCIAALAFLSVTVRRTLRRVMTLARRLEESERRYNLIAENGNDGILIVRGGAIEYVNQRMLHLTGFSKNELRDKLFFLLIAPAAKESFINEYYMRTRLKNVADTYETSIVSKERGSVAVELRIYSFEHGRGGAELLVVRDISERKYLEEERRRFSSFIACNPHLVIELTPEGNIHYANESAHRQFPSLAGQGAGHVFLAGFHQQAAVLKNGGKGSCNREVLINGRWYQRECYYARETGRFCVYGFDITDRKKAEESLIRSEEKYRTLFETITQGIMCHGTDGKIVAANPAAERIIGLPLGRMIYKNLAEICPGCIRDDGMPFAPETFPPAAALAAGKEVKDVVIGIPRAPGSEDRACQWITMSALPQFRPGEEQPYQVYTVFNDITEKRRTEKERENSETRYRRLFEGSRDGILIADGKTGEVIDLNPCLAGLLGYSRQELCGRKLWDIVPFKEMVPHRAAFVGMLLKEYSRCDAARVRNKEGHLLDVEFVSSVYDMGGRKVMQCGMRDISERKAAEDRVKYLSFHDKVTGLYNRTYGEEELRRIDTERSLPISIIMSDIDNLKLVNDAFGHATGDRLLVRIAGILRSSCRNGDIVARWGGDEFIILLPQTDAATARGIAERIQQECSRTSMPPVHPAVALGIATKDRKDQDINEVLREADDRMYRNKLTDSSSRQHSILSSLLQTLRERGHETVQHTQRLRRLAVELGREAGLSDNQMDALSLLAVLHDIGKIAVPDEVLSKAGPLTPKERSIVRVHSEAGYRIAQSFPALSHIADAVLAHHERWDGNGYPQGLRGKEIPLIARIFSIVEAYDVMLHCRPYGPPLTHREAAGELAAHGGGSFDPELVELFLQNVEPLRIIAGETAAARSSP